MENDKLETSVLASFHQKCSENNIWYSISGLSLLKLKNNRNINNDEVIEVMMKINDYSKLLNLYHENIIDSSTKNRYFFTNPIYHEKNSKTVIKINLMIKASIKKTEKFYSIKNLIRQNIGFYSSINKKIDNFKGKIHKSWFKFLGVFLTPLTWQEICLNIGDEKYNGYFVIDLFKGNINRNWIPAITNERERIIVNNIDAYIIKEWEVYLAKRFGADWKNIKDVENDFDISLVI